MVKRKGNLLQSLSLWSSFLQRLETLEILSNDEVKEFHSLLEAQNEVTNDGYSEEEEEEKQPLSTSSTPGFYAPPNRDAKIARFKAKRMVLKDIDRLKALRERRNRFQVAEEDEMDCHDTESLTRSLCLAQLSIDRSEAFESCGQTLRELPMIDRMARAEKEHRSTSKHGSSDNDHTTDPRSTKQQQPTSSSSNKFQ